MTYIKRKKTVAKEVMFTCTGKYIEHSVHFMFIELYNKREGLNTDLV